MDDFTPSRLWDVKLTNASINVKTYPCCPNQTFPKVEYEFSMERHSHVAHLVYITPLIGKIPIKTSFLFYKKNYNVYFHSFNIFNANGFVAGS